MSSCVPTAVGADQVSALAAQHLTSLGWQMEPETRGPSVLWFDFASRGSISGESAYVGPLADYLESGWAYDDEGAPEELRQAAGTDVAGIAVVQFFAREE